MGGAIENIITPPRAITRARALLMAPFFGYVAPALVSLAGLLLCLATVSVFLPFLKPHGAWLALGGVATFFQATVAITLRIGISVSTSLLLAANGLGLHVALCSLGFISEGACKAALSIPSIFRPGMQMVAAYVFTYRFNNAAFSWALFAGCFQMFMALLCSGAYGDAGDDVVDMCYPIKGMQLQTQAMGCALISIAGILMMWQGDPAAAEPEAEATGRTDTVPASTKAGKKRAKKVS